MTSKLSLILVLSLLHPSCNGTRNEDILDCLTVRQRGGLEILNTSYENFLQQNKLKDNMAFLDFVVKNGDSANYYLDIWTDSMMTESAINDLNSILWTKDSTYSRKNRFINCLKESSLVKTDLVKRYLGLKEDVGNISPILMAGGFLKDSSDDLEDELIKNLILIEVCLPIVRGAGCNSR